jgi:hypothetical protein
MFNVVPVVAAGKLFVHLSCLCWTCCCSSLVQQQQQQTAVVGFASSVGIAATRLPGW